MGKNLGDSGTAGMTSLTPWAEGLLDYQSGAVMRGLPHVVVRVSEKHFKSEGSKTMMTEQEPPKP